MSIPKPLFFGYLRFMPNPKIDVTNEDVDDMLLTLLLTLYVEDFRTIDTFLNSSDQRIVA